MKQVLSAIVLCSLVLATAAADSGDSQNDCMQGPMAQFGRYVGDWKIADEALARDGSGWGPGNGPSWIFKCVGNGTAVQDFWKPNNGGWDTNLRNYSPDTDSWEIVWASTGMKGLLFQSSSRKLRS